MSLMECEALICEVMDGLSYGKVEWGPEMKQVAFMKLGLDSLDAVKLVDDLNVKLAPTLELSKTAIFEHPNVRELTAFIHEELTGKTVRLTPPSASSAGTAPPLRDA